MGSIRGLKAICAALVIGAYSFASAEEPYQVAWSAQTGTPYWDLLTSVGVDSSANSYVSVTTYGGATGLGGPESAFVAKYDGGGTQVWTRQINTAQPDVASGVATDVWENAFVTGFTRGNLVGTSGGGEDAFLIKYDPGGSILWTRQIAMSNHQESWSVAVDASGSAYISGETNGSLGGPNAGGYDAFLVKYDTAGNLLWSRQLGSAAHDYCRSVAIDGLGNAYITGTTQGNLAGANAGEEDAFLAKYSGTGDLLWSRQIGTAEREWSYSLAVNASGNAYITGCTSGDLAGANAGSSDVFLAKFDAGGDLLWSRQMGTSYADDGYGLAVNALGCAFITGSTQGSLAGPNAGDWDVFLAEFDPNGDIMWATQVGTNAVERSNSVALDACSNVYISGDTDGSFGGPSAGHNDALLVKFEVPEPPTLDVSIDVRPPGINLSSKGVTPVVIFGSEGFDVETLNLESLVLSGSSPKEKGKSGTIGSFEDVNGDSILDLILHFRTCELDVEPDATELILMGSLNDETEINGSDAVRIVKYAVGGDCNLDGSVDVGDLGILASNYQGSDLSWAEGDFNGNAMVDVGDLGVFASNYGTVSPPTIPEPASAILLLLGFSGVLCKRMKKEIAGL